MALSDGIRSALRRHAGLGMNAHLFRHAIAKTAVEADPGAYLAVQKKNFTALELGRHLFRTERQLAAHDPGRRDQDAPPVTFDLPKILLPWFERYLAFVRPRYFLWHRNRRGCALGRMASCAIPTSTTSTTAMKRRS
jgi:hypothetical protein